MPKVIKFGTKFKGKKMTGRDVRINPKTGVPEELDEFTGLWNPIVQELDRMHPDNWPLMVVPAHSSGIALFPAKTIDSAELAIKKHRLKTGDRDEVWIVNMWTNELLKKVR